MNLPSKAYTVRKLGWKRIGIAYQLVQGWSNMKRCQTVATKTILEEDERGVQEPESESVVIV